MRARDLLKWKRALNEIKFKHEELELIKEIVKATALNFICLWRNTASKMASTWVN